MGLIAICPYFKKESGGYTHCEVCRFKFKDAEMRNAFIKKYCASFEYKSCSICNEIDYYYERKELGIVNETKSEEII